MYEIIVVDDCSTDGTYQRLASQLGKWEQIARVIQLTENSGRPAKPRNTGLKMAQGEWVMFMDADDLMPVDYVSYLANTTLDEETIYGLNRQKVSRPVVTRYSKRPKFFRIPTWCQRYKNVICFSGTLLKADIAKTGRFPEAYLEDWLYFQELLCSRHLIIRKTSNMSLQYRHSDASLTPSKLTQVKRIWGIHSAISLLLYGVITVCLMTYEHLAVWLESRSVNVTQ